MRLLLDECAGGRDLRDALIAAGHDVVRSVDVLGGGADDPTVFAFACTEDRVVITYNNIDFLQLAQHRPTHPGMLLIYRDSKQREIAIAEVVQAVANVESINPTGIAGTPIALNHYQW